MAELLARRAVGSEYGTRTPVPDEPPSSAKRNSEMPPKRETRTPTSSRDDYTGPDVWRRYLSTAGRDVAARWTEPCRALFDALAKQHPADLASLVKSRALEPEDLTFAAEKLGETDVPSASEILRDLILDESTSAVVKEGALYGLHQVDGVDLTDVLRALTQSASPALRRIATKLIARRRG